MTTLFFIEHANGKVSDQSLKAISATKDLGEEVHGILAGTDIESVVEEASKISGVSKIIHIENDEFSNILAEKLTSAILDISDNYNYFCAAATTTGKNVMPRVAAKLDVSQISEIIGVESNDTFIRTIYAGNAIATVQSSDAKKVLTIRPTAYKAAEASDTGCEVEKINPENIPNISEYISEELTKSDRPELTSAKIIISGAIQHLAGMKDSKVIVAINKDEEAPIFDIADYGLVADLFQVLPELEGAI